MNFQDAIRTCFSKYADFNGRVTRPEYWWFVLFVVLCGIVLSLFSAMLAGIFSLATVVPAIAAATRRLHDTQRSGWWQLICLVPVIGWVVLLVFLAQDSNAA